MIKIKRKLVNTIWRFFPKLVYWEKAKIYYKSHTGKELDYKNPKNINEKLMWLTRYWQHPLKTICADKYLVRDYLTQRGYDDILIPLLGVWDSPEQIDFDKLPNQFVPKCNHGSGYNIICIDKSCLDISEVKRKLNCWLNEDFSNRFYELHYQRIPRKIICEQLISKAPVECQFWCVNGKVDSILACLKGFDGSYKAYSYSLDKKRLYERINENEDDVPNSELDFHISENLIKYAENLAKPFPFVRVDFYVVENKIYFAELTFTPNANILKAYKDVFLNRLDEKLILPKKYK